VSVRAKATTRTLVFLFYFPMSEFFSVFTLIFAISE